jgi:Circularly permutated YpsA SLOG family
MAILPMQKLVYLERIVSGGQTGVDRAALDVALELGIPHGGWCPLGRLAEDGFIPTRYALRQTNSSQYALRTERNVLDATGTLILYSQTLSGGTELTWRFCQMHKKPACTVDLSLPINLDSVLLWIEKWQIQILNVAGPRESSLPGIGEQAKQYIRLLMQHLCSNKPRSLFAQFDRAEAQSRFNDDTHASKRH